MKKLCLLILLLVTLVTCGCKQTQAPAARLIDENTSQSYGVIDVAGRTLHFEQKPQRIVSLTYGTDEILTDLVDIKRIAAYSR